MADWIEILDGFISMSKQDVLSTGGKISAELAEKKAQIEYDKYKQKASEELTEVEQHFIESITRVEKNITRKAKES
jgi:hypothetical protein